MKFPIRDWSEVMGRVGRMSGNGKWIKIKRENDGNC